MLNAFLLSIVVTCAGVNDTLAIQTALDSGDVELQGTCLVPGIPGVKLPSDRTLDMRGAIVSQGPNRGGSGINGRNRMFETVVGAQNIKVIGGTLIGSRTYVGGLQWSIGLRIDSASHVTVEGTVFRDWYTDGLYVGGNPPGSTHITIRNVTISNSKRNALSVVCGSHIFVLNSIFETSNCASDAPNNTCSTSDLNMPLCGIDWEPNAGDTVNDVSLLWNTIRNNQKCGAFIQSGMGNAGSRYLIAGNRFENNGTIGLIVNQISSAVIDRNFVSGGTVGYSFGAGASNLTIVNNEVSNTSSNGINFAGVWHPFAAFNKTNGERVFYVAITSPVNMDAVAGYIDIRPFQ